MNSLVDKLLNIGVTVDDTQVNELQQELETIDDQVLDEIVQIDETDITNTQQELETIDDQTLNEKIEIEDSGIEEATQKIDQLGNAGTVAGTEIQTGMNGASQSTGELGRTTEDTAKKTEDLGNKSTQAGQAAETGFAEAALALSGLLAGLQLTADQVDELNIRFSKMSNSAGSIPEGKLRDLVATLSNAHFPSDEVLDYITLLKQMGVTSEDSLGRGATAMNEMRIATGTSEDTIKKFANSIVVMGINLDDLPSAFNAIAYAQANVVGGFDTYVQWMQKYDSTFKDMGLNIDQTAVLIAAATKKFGGGRAAYQGLNEAIQDSNGNLSVLEQKLGMQPGALSRASEETAKYSGKIERNTQSVEDHVGVYQKLQAVWDDILVRGGDILAMLLQVGIGIGGLAGIFGLVLPKILGYMDEIFGWQNLQKYVEFTNDVVTGMKDFGSRIISTIKSWAPSWSSESGKSAEGIGKAIDGEIKSDSILSKFKDFGSRIRDVITRDWSIWGDDAGQVTIDMVKNMDGTWEMKSPGFLEKIARFGRSIPTVLSDAMGSVGIKLPSFEGVGADIGSTILKGLSKIAIPLAVAQMLLEGIYNFEDNLKKDPLDVVLDTYLLRPFYNLIVPEPVRKFIDDLTSIFAPANLGRAIFGQGYTDLTVQFNDQISKPVREWVDNFWPNIQASLGGIGSFDIMGLLFGGVSGDPTAGLSGIYTGIVTSFTGIITFLSTIPGQIASVFTMEGFNAVLDGALFNIGRFARAVYELPGQILAALQNLPAMAAASFNNFIAYLQTLPGQFTAWGSKIFNGLVTGFNSSIGSIRSSIDQVPNKVNELITWFKNLPTTLYNLAKSAYQGLINGFNSMLQSIKDAGTNAMRKVDEGIQYIKDLPGNMYNWGSQTIQSWIKGLQDWINGNWNGFKSWLDDRLKSLWSGWETHSPPKALPDIDKWGAGLAKTYLESVADGIKDGKGIIESSLTPLTQSFNLLPNVGSLTSLGLSDTTMQAVAASTPGNNNKISIDVKVDMGNANINSMLDAEEAGERAGKSAAEKFASEALDLGISTVNSKR